ncbi:hypothetical protein J437_LFUL019205, partial [Ladona fulva]
MGEEEEVEGESGVEDEDIGKEVEDSVVIDVLPDSQDVSKTKSPTHVHTHGAFQVYRKPTKTSRGGKGQESVSSWSEAQHQRHRSDPSEFLTS